MHGYPRVQRGTPPNAKTVGADLQKIGQDNYEAMFRSYGEMNKGWQAVFANWAEFSKRFFEDATRTCEKLIAVKSLDQAYEIQTNYAKNAYENWMAEMSKLGGMYSSIARDAYKPVENTMEKQKA